jgi:hypothetical protein
MAALGIRFTACECLPKRRMSETRGALRSLPLQVGGSARAERVRKRRRRGDVESRGGPVAGERSEQRHRRARTVHIARTAVEARTLSLSASAAYRCPRAMADCGRRRRAAVRPNSTGCGALHCAGTGAPTRLDHHHLFPALIRTLVRLSQGTAHPGASRTRAKSVPSTVTLCTYIQAHHHTCTYPEET